MRQSPSQPRPRKSGRLSKNKFFIPEVFISLIFIHVEEDRSPCGGRSSAFRTLHRSSQSRWSWTKSTGRLQGHTLLKLVQDHPATQHRSSAFRFCHPIAPWCFHPGATVQELLLHTTWSWTIFLDPEIWLRTFGSRILTGSSSSHSRWSHPDATVQELLLHPGDIVQETLLYSDYLQCLPSESTRVQVLSPSLVYHWESL